MKVLVVSNNCFARNNSNGRILGCLFRTIGKENISQLYITPGSNDFDLCSDYYLISDKMLLNAWDARRHVGKVITSDDTVNDIPKMSLYRSKFGRSSITMLVRELLWRSNKWWNREFRNWLSNTNANVIVFQCGDSPFMYRIVDKIRRYLDVPVVLFNTEYYYFLNESWLPVKDNKVAFWLFKRILNHYIAKSISSSALSIYNSDWLKERYSRVFSSRAEVLYQSSDYSIKHISEDSETPKISYVGNLGFGRWEPLVEIAEAIKSINKRWKIDVYGIAQSKEVNELLAKTACLDFHGPVSYDVAAQVIAKSDLLLIVENQRPHLARATEYGFSGKITDYLYSGIPILAYGSDSNVGISYLKETNSAMVISAKEDLVPSLKKSLFDKKWRQASVSSALATARTNHSAEMNAEMFKKYLVEIVLDGGK